MSVETAERPGVDTTLYEPGAELQASEERTRSLFAMSPDGISVADHTGRILLCNEQFARIHGYEHSAEIIGRYAAEFMLPEVYAGLFNEVAAAFAAGESVVSGIEVEVSKRDGATITTVYSVAEVPWPDAPAGVALISHIRDITRRKALLAELERHQTLLEGQVQERTRDLEAEIAERAALQTTLQRTEAILAEAQRIALLGTWEVDLATDEVRLSDEVCRIWGLDPEARPFTPGDIWNAILHPDDRSAVQAALARAVQPDQTYSSQCRIVLPGGETRVIYLRGEVVRDAEGRPTHINGLVQDITEQERMKQVLDQRVKELLSLEALSSVANLRLSLEETIRLALEKIVTLAGLDMAKLLLLRENRLYQAGVRLGELVSGTQSQIFTLGECLCGLAVRDGRPVYAKDIENDERCSRTYCRVQGLRSVVALPLRSGEVIIGALALGSVTRDAFADRLPFLETAAEQIAVALQNARLHEEIQARAAGLEEIVAERTRELQTERDRTQAILETVGESVVVTDLDGQVLFLNPAATALTGFTRNELLGQPIWRDWSAETLTQIWPQVQRALRAGQTWQGEITGRRKDGAIYIAALTGTPLHDERAAPLATGGVWVQRDITALKEAARLKDQFVSNVSHELRTPISIIALSSDNLEAFYDRLDETQRRQMLRDIHGQAHVLSEVVEDILVLSQIDSGRVTGRKSRIDLAHLVREEAVGQQPRAEGRSQRLSITTGAAVVVMGNEAQLRRVIRNLLDNAIKYAPAGGRIACTCEIRVVARAATPEGRTRLPGSWAAIEVADDGFGIPPDAIPFLFERFFRVNGEEGMPGTGLGLSIARELVLLHEGWIDVASTPGAGSTFTVYLPLAE
jgi:PAS domain S-box-containing protein